MGCLFCNPVKDPEEEVPKPKEYSWDSRPKINPNDFIISNLKGEDTCRVSGSVNGQQFVIQNCSNSMIFVLDYIDSINIDDCTNCKIVLGPVKGSVFVRDCLDCVLVVPCGQFRMRDSHRLDIFLHCATQPIIESSTHIRFACIRLHYDLFKDHMEKACLSPFNNLWSSIHDFTPVDGDGNWRKLPTKVRLQEYITPPFPPQLRDAGWTVSADSVVIPISLGITDFTDGSICFVLIFGDSENKQCEVAMEFLSSLLSQNDKCALLSSREVQLQSVDAASLGLKEIEERKLEAGPAVGLVLSGPSCLESCLEIIEQLGIESKVYISPDHSIAAKQASSFQQCAAMHLGC